MHCSDSSWDWVSSRYSGSWWLFEGLKIVVPTTRPSVIGGRQLKWMKEVRWIMKGPIEEGLQRRRRFTTSTLSCTRLIGLSGRSVAGVGCTSTGKANPIIPCNSVKILKL